MEGDVVRKGLELGNLTYCSGLGCGVGVGWVTSTQCNPSAHAVTRGIAAILWSLLLSLNSICP